MLSLDQPLLVNMLGHAAGALIFAIFLILLFSGRGWSGQKGRRLSGLAAALSLIWNLGSLIVLVVTGLPATAVSLVVAFTFSALSLIPAVLLHVSVGAERLRLVACGYLLSAVAIGMHFWEIRGNQPGLHQTALLIITVGFLLLTAVAVTTGRRRPGGLRIAASMCLALFAMSFVHFGSAHMSQVWSSELIFHHAGIPLALFVLLQDYRFVLLDAFVRFLANALLAAVLTWLVIEAAFRLVLVERAARDPLSEAILLVSVCLFLVLFAWLRNRAQSWLTLVVFRHGDVATLAARLKDSPAVDSEERYLSWAAGTIATCFHTTQSAVVAQSEIPDADGLHTPSLAAFPNWPWCEAVVPVRLGPGTAKLILLGPRAGGRRYLGEDLDALVKAAAQIGERLEAMRRQEMDRLVDQAELRALQSQVNPHFLFNALNTVYGTIPREAIAARRTVLNLADIFRYSLQSDKILVPLAEELDIVRAYLEVEQTRLGDRLTFHIHLDPQASAIPVPVLSVQPLVENAIKHGISQRTDPGLVEVEAVKSAAGLRVTVTNTTAPAGVDTPGTGIGLQNVRRRLEICCGPAARLQLTVAPDITTAELHMPLAEPA